MVLGISLDENYACVCVDGDNNVLSLPFAVGRNLNTNTWFIGDEAKNENIDNGDIVIDKLFYIIRNDVPARIGEISYEAKELIKIFFSSLLSKYDNIEYVTVVVRNGDVRYLEKIKYALISYFKDSDKFKVSTYSEAFVSFIKSKDAEYYNDAVSLFDFTEKALTYYELVRYIDDNNIEYWKVDTEEHLALPLDLLSGDAGKKVCDNLLYDFAKRSISEEKHGNIVLSGLGFSDTSSYRDFMTYVCSFAKVETDVCFFAKSAYLLSMDILNNNFDENVMIITDARTMASVKLLATVNQVNTKVELIKPGVEWFDIKDNTFDIIVDGDTELRFEILKVIERVVNEEKFSIPEAMVRRQDKTNLLQICFMFTEQRIMQLSLIDKGFGEFYESSIEKRDKEIRI
ncbi:MAG: hypothetical protein J6M39_07060 [Lachnospiraceae bacterium]|nr:hypothetical protein [Lachnospiraceae bacterium]